MYRPVLVLGVVLLSPGCLSLLGDCPNGSPWVFSWDQAGIFSALENATLPTSWTAGQSRPQGLPFENASLEVRLGQSALVEVAWFQGPPSIGRTAGIRMDRDGRVALTQAETGPDSRVRTWAMRFAENVSASDATTTEMWAQAFAASRTPAEGPNRGDETPEYFRYEAALGPPFAVERAWASAGIDAAGPMGSRWGAVNLGANAWSFAFLLPTNNATTVRAGYDLKLEVDVLDRVRFVIDGERRPEEAAARKLAEDAFAELGLPGPTPPDWDLRREGPIC